MPALQAFSKVLTQLNLEYGPRGFRALGVAFDEEDPKDQVPLKDKAAAYAKNTRDSQWVSRLGQRCSATWEFRSWSALEFPQIVVIDRKGVIRGQSHSQGGGPLTDPAHLKTLVESLLAEGAGAKAPAKSGASTANCGKKTADKKTSE